MQHLVLTLEQDLVVINAFYTAADNPGGSKAFNTNGDPGMQIITNALGPQGTNYNPVDPYTGNIWDAQGNWVGWEDLDTGNIFDAEGILIDGPGYAGLASGWTPGVPIGPSGIPFVQGLISQIIWGDHPPGSWGFGGGGSGGGGGWDPKNKKKQ